jgi:hypothetical protein
MSEQETERFKEILTQLSHEAVVQSLMETGFFRRLGEEIPKQISKDAKLFNIHLSTAVVFQDSHALYIPVAISDTQWGRRTIYNLPVGEKTLMGIYVQNDRIYQEFFNRIDEDTYDVTVSTMLSDRVVYSGRGRLERIDERVGYGRLNIVESETNEEKALIWALWSVFRKT